jgi:hypothetical protein
MSAGGGIVERFEGQVVGRAQVAAADFEERIEGAVVDGARAAPATAHRWATYWASSSRESRRSWA